MISAIGCRGSRSPPIIATTARPSQVSRVAKHSAGVRGGMDTRLC